MTRIYVVIRNEDSTPTTVVAARYNEPKAREFARLHAYAYAASMENPDEIDVVEEDGEYHLIREDEGLVVSIQVCETELELL